MHYVFLLVAILTGCSQQIYDSQPDVKINVDKTCVKYSATDVVHNSKSKLRNGGKCAKISTGATVARGYSRPNSLEYRDKNTMCYIGGAMGTGKNSQKFAVEKRFSGGF